MKYVIMNADDFGATSGVNHAIIRAHTEGVLTSASLMVNESSVGEAVEFAIANPKLAVGLHLVLSDGHSALERRQVPHLVGDVGRFRSSPVLAGISYFFSRAARHEVRAEVEAQFSRFAATGLPFSHVDGHQHLHMHPVIWDAMVEQCEAYGVRRVRIVNEEFRPGWTGRTLIRRLEWLVFWGMRIRRLRTIRKKGFIVADRVYGHLETGNMDLEYTCDLLSNLGGLTNEIYFHPGTRHARQLVGGAPGMDVELDALISPAVRKAIDKNNICLTTYPALERFAAK